DPAVATAFGTVQTLQLIFDTLLRTDPNGRLVPGLAQSWETGADGRTRALAVAVTMAPARLASWTTYPPTPPPPPLTTIVRPAFRPACSNRACHAVRAADGNAAASAGSTVRGAAASTSAGAATYSAAAPGSVIGRNATTASPALQPATPSPTSAMTPATSKFGTCGKSTGNTCCMKPARMATSTGLNAAPATLTTTCPEPATGRCAPP